MPANLPPQYKEAEERYRQARTNEEKVLALEDMLAIIPHHKGTDKLIAQLRKRLSQH
ncbi:MAG: GTP-binding protein, partial [Deltaproteobacteria bacterium]|nr:GTP-binding protein [Deltaproteobacteria bacterium]